MVRYDTAEAMKRVAGTVMLLFTSAVLVLALAAVVDEAASPQSERNHTEYDSYVYWVGTGSYDM